MLFWIARYFVASLNLAICATLTYVVAISLPCFSFTRWDIIAEYGIPGVIAFCAGMAAVGLVVPQLLRFGLRWHMAVLAPGILWLLFLSFTDHDGEFGNKQWPYGVAAAVSVGLAWAGLCVGIEVLARRTSVKS